MTESKSDTSNRPVKPEDVTDVMKNALDKLAKRSDSDHEALKLATQRLIDEAQRTREMAQRLSNPPSDTATLPPPAVVPVVLESATEDARDEQVEDNGEVTGGSDEK